MTHGHYAYGDPEESASDESSQGFDIASILSPLAAGITGQYIDPVRQAGVLRAKLADAIARGRPLREIQILQAKLAAADRKAMLSEETAGTQRAYNQLGQIGAVVGIGVGVAGLIYLSIKIVNEVRR